MILGWISENVGLDLCAGDGRPSFNKIGWWVVCVLAFMADEFGPATMLILGAWAFGRSTIMALINRSNLNLSSSHSRQQTEIINRRDPVEGIDPA